MKEISSKTLVSLLPGGIVDKVSNRELSSDANAHENEISGNGMLEKLPGI